MENTPYLTIRKTCEVTGLSMTFLRNGCISGSVPHIKSGNRYYINVPRLLAALEAAEGADNEPRAESERIS